MYDITNRLLMSLQKLVPGINEDSLIILAIAVNIIMAFVTVSSLLFFLLSRNKLIKLFSGISAVFFTLLMSAQIILYVDMTYIEPNWIKVLYHSIKFFSQESNATTLRSIALLVDRLRGQRGERDFPSRACST